jgi:amino acid transporter
MKTPAASTRKLGLPELIAMGVGGMIGGGIFSVLGLAVGIAGHAAPLAFLLGAFIALAAGYSYVKLALTFRDDGASYTYLARAFPAAPFLSTLGGWTVIVGYVGTLALYAFTFGAYGADLLGQGKAPLFRMMLSALVLLFFLATNLRSAKDSGGIEDLIVYSKIALLGFFALAGAFTVKPVNLVPIFDHGLTSVFMAGALVFVAFEGFQLITNTLSEMRDPDHNVPRGIYISIAVTSLIYIILALIGVGNLGEAQLIEAKEYALAAAARPVLGETGVVLVGIAALLATSSAINATVFGASRMMAQMALESRMPRPFAHHNRKGAPNYAVFALIGFAGLFTLAGKLEVIAAFSSMTFLLVSMGVSAANLKLHHQSNSKPSLVLLGLTLMGTTVVLLLVHLWDTDRQTLAIIAGIYGVVGSAAALYGFWRRRR